MSRRIVAACSLVVVLSMTVPLYAAPRVDPSQGQSFFDRFVQQIRRVILDLNEVSVPKP
jgi:hypothetical protein